MKKYTIIILIILSLPGWVQADNSFIFFGDDRPFLPGIELMNSIYAVNPAKVADAVHNSIAFSSILYFGNIDNPDRIEHSPFGMYYAMTIPNFAVVNITQNSIVYDAEQSATNLSRDMLGLQLGLSLLDFVSLDNLNLALGLAINKLRDVELDSRQVSESFKLDFGLTSMLAGINLDLLAKNFFSFGEGELDFIGPDCNVILQVGSKIILDVDFVLGVSSARAYELFTAEEMIDFLVEIQFIRYFLSNSLRTGVGLELFFDLDNDSNQIPIVRYNIAVNYSLFNSILNNFNLQDLQDDDQFLARSGSLLLRLLQNLTFTYGSTIIVNSIPGHTSFVPSLSLGVTKFY